MRRFIFAYCGLEVLVQRAQARVRPLLTSDLQSKLPRFPVKELLWPDKSDDIEPDRNLVFKFASLASVVNPASAAADTEKFRTIVKARNALAHGDAEDPDSVPGNEAAALLHDYIAATTTALESGGLL